MIHYKHEYGMGAGIVFIPPLVSLLVFGKSRGMSEALQIGINISFVLIAVGFVSLFFYLVFQAIKAIREGTK